MTHPERLSARILVMLALMLFAPSASAEDAELRILPDWEVRLIQNQVPFRPLLLPAEILRADDPDETFDNASGWWAVKVGPLDGKLTVFQLQVFETDGNEAAHPGITIAIPNARKTYPIPVTRFRDMDALEPGDTVRNAYRDGIDGDLSELERDRRWLNAFFSAEHMLGVILGDAAIEDVTVHPPIVRTLTVYAESVAHLVGRTEWFGLPGNFQERIRMIDHVEQQAEADRGLRSDINMDRLKRAAEGLRASRYQLYGRLWRNIVDGYPVKCNNSFPDATYLYETMEAMTDAEYALLKSQLSINRTIVLNEAIRCFRELMTRDDRSAWFLDIVVDDEFGGRTGPQVLATLKDAAVSELYNYGREFGDAARNGECSGAGDRNAAILCESLNFLEAIENRLEEEPRNVVRS